MSYRNLETETPDFPDDFDLEESTLDDLIQDRDFQINEEKEDGFQDFWLPPEKPLRF